MNPRVGLAIDFSLIDLEQHVRTQNCYDPSQLKIDYGVKSVVKNGVKVKLKKASLEFREGSEKVGKIKVKAKIVGENRQGKPGFLFLVGKLQESDLTYFFALDLTN